MVASNLKSFADVANDFHSNEALLWQAGYTENIMV